MLQLLRQLLHHKPFYPIRIVMKSGERHEIVNHERVAIGKSQVFLCQRGKQMAWLNVNDIELVFQPHDARCGTRRNPLE